MLSEKIKKEQMAFTWRQMMPSVLKAIRSKTKLPEVIEKLENDSEYKDIYEKWDNLSLDEMRDAWDKVTLLLSKTAYATRPYCMRCGDCCAKSSPTLYNEDLPLFMNNVLDSTNVFTLRKGEIGYSPQERRTVTLGEEMLKVKEVQSDEGQCIFFKDKQCTIYDDRPAQCRTLECWNPEGFKSLSALKPLNRKAVLTETHPFWKIIASHEERCSLTDLRNILEGNKDMDAADEEKVLDIVFYDQHVRIFMKEKADMKDDDMDFYFGQPAIRTLSACGYVVEEQEGQRPRVKKLAEQAQAG